MIKLQDLIPIHDLSEGKFRKGDRVVVTSDETDMGDDYGKRGVSAPGDYEGKKGTVTDVLAGGDTLSVKIDGIEYKKVVFSPDQLKKESLNEARYETYHNNVSSALNAVEKFVEKKGYDVDEDDWYSKVALGGSSGRARPGEGKTNRFSVELTKNGKSTNRQVHFQIYGMENGRYELNMYID